MAQIFNINRLSLAYLVRWTIVVLGVSGSCFFWAQNPRTAGSPKVVQEPARDALSALCDAGLAAYREGRVKDAVDLLKPCVQKSGRVMGAWRVPERRDAVVTLGLAYLDTGDELMAMDIFGGIVAGQQAITPFEVVHLDIESARAYYGIGAQYYVSYGDPGMREFSMVAAIESFKKAISLDPNYSEAFRYLGYCYDAQHNYELAIGAYLEAVRIDPNNVKALNGLGLAYRGLDRPADAVGPLLEAIRIKPDFVAPHCHLAMTSIDLGDIETAYREYEVLAKLAPEQTREIRYYWADVRGAFRK